MKSRSTGKIKAMFRKLHFWLGLATGLIVFIVAVTGCIFVFHDEIKDVAYEWRHVTPENQAFIKPSVLIEKAQKLYPETSSNMVVYYGKSRPALVYLLINEKPFNLYFNPYSGTFLHAEDTTRSFFPIVEAIHMYLLLPEAIGRQVVGISTLIFLFMLISGLILWYPKNWKKGSKNFKIKWSARWRRVNYDWHKTTGMYIAILAFIIALTGLTFSYEWMHQTFYKVGNLGTTYESDFFKADLKSDTITNVAINKALTETKRLLPESNMIFIMKQADSLPVITGAYPESLIFHKQSNFYFHPESGALLNTQFYDNKSTGLKFQEINYGLHTGQCFGLTGKILAFIISLFVAGLPVSGFLIWYGRKYKTQKT